MKKSEKQMRVTGIMKPTAVLLIAAVAVSGCAGAGAGGQAETVVQETEAASSAAESTAPGVSSEVGSEMTNLDVTTDAWKADKADRDNVWRQLELVTGFTRASGTEGEEMAASAIAGEFEAMGYETRQEAFSQKTLDEYLKPVSGTNVVAVKKADVNPETADILYITAHHDGKPGIQGAEDDAAGVAVMLETARLLGELTSDTEIRFVSFAGEENGRVGSRYHVEQLTDAERSRVIGDIQLDDLGYWGADYLQISTVDGKQTMLGELLSKKALNTPNVGREIPVVQDEMSDHNAFHSHGMPAMMLGQDAFAFENHSTQDQTQIIDPDRMKQTAQLVADVAAGIMSEETEGSLLKMAYAAGHGQDGYRMENDAVIQFSMDRNYVENGLGLSGKLVDQGTNEYNDKLETWSYPLYWFDLDSSIETLFHYRNVYLEEVEIPADDAIGKTLDEAKTYLTTQLGEASENEGDVGTSYGWEDLIYHKYVSLEPVEGGTYHIMINNDSQGSETSATYDLSKGFDQLKPESDGDAKLLELVKGVIYPDDQPLVSFRVYTDGKSGTTGVTGGLTNDDISQMDYGLDYVDALDDAGEFRKYNKTLRTAVHEYGHVLSLNCTQVDITKQDASMPSIFYEQETYAKDAYMRGFYEKFWKGLDVKSGADDYTVHPEHFVSEYASNNASEDFAESFMLFVLSSEPDDDSLASQKIRFFYDYDEMVQRRDYIRGNFGIEETSGRMAPELAEEDYRVALDGNPTTGYSWQYSMAPTGVVEEAANGYYQNYHERDLVGAGGTFVFDFKGVKEGTADVTFRYVRPWVQGEAVETKVYRLTVDGQGKVSGEEVQQ